MKSINSTQKVLATTALLAMTMGLANCNPVLHGSLSLLKNLDFIATETIFKGGKKGKRKTPKQKKVKKVPGSLPIGTYSASLKYISKTQLDLIIGDTIISLEVPKNKSLPEHSGNFHLNGSDIGQPWGVAGNVDTDVQIDGPHYGTEDCSITEYHEECRTVEETVDGERKRYKKCETISETYYGDKDVEFQYVQTTKSVQMEIQKGQMSVVLGEFSGSSIDNDKRYLYQGSCILH